MKELRKLLEEIITRLELLERQVKLMNEEKQDA